MTVEILLQGKRHKISLENPIDISIPLDFEKPQPNAFDLPNACKSTVKNGNFVGSVVEGGSCNCDQITLTPHGNGTHTECVGHLTKKRISISEILTDPFIVTRLITIAPTNNVISHKELAVVHSIEETITGLIIRTVPNPRTKSQKKHSGTHPTHFSPDAIELLNKKGIQHLLVDLPSLDAENDPMLTAHRLFWNLPLGAPDPTKPSRKTITELIYIDDSVPDGHYLLNLQIPPFVLDAAPSRPLLFPF